MKQLLILILLISFSSCVENKTQSSMPKLEKDYQVTTIEWTIDEEVSLLILLHKDGTINRKGNGTSEIDPNFYMGRLKDSLLNDLTKSITPSFETLLNKVYDDPDKEGKICTLEITLNDGHENFALKYIYGSQSEAPPAAVTDYVNNAIELTDPLYNKQVQILKENVVE